MGEAIGQIIERLDVECKTRWEGSESDNGNTGGHCDIGIGNQSLESATTL